MRTDRVLTLLDVLWFGHRYYACRIAGWLTRSDGHRWDTTGHTTPPTSPASTSP